MVEFGLRYKWYRIGFEISTKMQWWRVADWFWHRKMTRFWIAIPQEADYLRKDGTWVIHNGW